MLERLSTYHLGQCLAHSQSCVNVSYDDDDVLVTSLSQLDVYIVFFNPSSNTVGQVLLSPLANSRNQGSERGEVTGEEYGRARKWQSWDVNPDSPVLKHHHVLGGPLPLMQSRSCQLERPENLRTESWCPKRGLRHLLFSSSSRDLSEHEIAPCCLFFFIIKERDFPVWAL